MTARVWLPVVLVFSAGIFFSGIGWGLPSHRVDRFLFGGQAVWSGREILARAGDRGEEPGEAGRGSDVSGHPLDRTRPQVVNATDAERARIVRRYRLMSHQPDEFTTFAALSSMKPGRGDLDPRMYKYGGFWVYPVGALLRAAGGMRLVQVRSDLAWYLDHPEAFGRFYVVARAYSSAWGLVGVVAVFGLVRRICGSVPAAALAGAGFCLMPVVVNAAHEAKPHLAGAVLMLLAVWAGARYAERGSRRLRFAAAVLCGAAVGMVLSAAPILLVAVGMELLRARNRREGGWRWVARTPMPVLVAIAVYCAGNPYVPINFVFDRALFRSTMQNSAAFYHASWWGGGVPNGVWLVGLGASFVLATAGVLAIAALLARAVRYRNATGEAEVRRRSTGLLLALPCVAAGAQFLVFAADQPADYARFALPFDVFLLIEAAVAIQTFLRNRRVQVVAGALLFAGIGMQGIPYELGFARDSSGDTTRISAADVIAAAGETGAGPRVLVSKEEPAPWSLPPVDLFKWRIVVEPKTAGATRFDSVEARHLYVAPSDTGPTPISWAAKPFVMRAVEPGVTRRTN